MSEWIPGVFNNAHLSLPYFWLAELSFNGEEFWWYQYYWNNPFQPDAFELCGISFAIKYNNVLKVMTGDGQYCILKLTGQNQIVKSSVN